MAIDALTDGQWFGIGGILLEVTGFVLYLDPTRTAFKKQCEKHWAVVPDTDRIARKGKAWCWTSSHIPTIAIGMVIVGLLAQIPSITIP